MKSLLCRCLPFALILAVTAGWCVAAETMADQSGPVASLGLEED